MTGHRRKHLTRPKVPPVSARALEEDLVVEGPGQSVVDPVASLAGCVSRRREVDRDQLVAVQAARARGLSWQVIGDALGVTRQSARAWWVRNRVRPSSQAAPLPSEASDGPAAGPRPARAGRGADVPAAAAAGSASGRRGRPAAASTGVSRARTPRHGR